MDSTKCSYVGANPFDNMPYTSRPLTPEALGTLSTFNEVAEKMDSLMVIGGGAGTALLIAEAELGKKNYSFKEARVMLRTLNNGFRKSDFDMYSNLSTDEFLVQLQKRTDKGVKWMKHNSGYDEFVFNDLKFQMTQVDSHEFSLTSSRSVQIPKNQYDTYNIRVVHPGYIAAFKLQRNEIVDPGDVMTLILRGVVKRNDVDYALGPMGFSPKQSGIVLKRYEQLVQRVQK